jgi:flagellum-specific peptidoglycan hydrolase FlgJ
MPPSAFFAMLTQAAQACQKQTGIPASLTLAQAALESGWGTRAPGNNLFGIKPGSSWKGPTIDFLTTEHIDGKDVHLTLTFRAYPNWQASMLDHAQVLLGNHYAACRRETTGTGWARAVAAAGYATDPKYADKLVSIIRDYNLAFRDQVNP